MKVSFGDLTELAIGAASERLARGEVSSSALTEAYLARIAALDPTLNCYVATRAEEARAETPPGRADILFKFIPPETLERFGGPERFARAVDASLDRLATFVKNPGRLPELLFGKA